MTQDIGPEDEAVQGAEEPAEQPDTSKKRTSAWPWVALAVVLLLLIWFLWQYLDGAKPPSGATITTTGVVPVTPDGDGIMTEESDVASGTDVESGVPDVVGMTRPVAIAEIQAAGYRASVTDVYGTSKPANTVVQQSPTGGAMLREGGTVGLLVQRRPGTQPMVTMPKLTGLSQSEAKRKLNALGLEIVVSYAPKGTQPAGTVRSQWPLAGVDVIEGGKVQIQVNVKP